MAARAAERDLAAVRTLLPQVYDELRALAGARLALQASGHTLQATALVHEAYLKLVSGTKGDDIGFASRAQFFAAAARSMRNILVDHARARMAIKRGGDQQRVELDDGVVGLETDPGEILALHELLSALEREDARKASIVSMKFFGGMTGEEIGAVLGTSGRTVVMDDVTGKEVGRIAQPSAECVRFSRDGRMLFCGSRGGDDCARVYGTRGWKRIGRDWKIGPVWDADWSPDGRWAAAEK